MKKLITSFAALLLFVSTSLTAQTVIYTDEVDAFELDLLNLNRVYCDVTNQLNWGSETEDNMRNYVGVTWDNTVGNDGLYHVTKIVVPNKGLTGEMHLYGFPYLKEIDISNNNLTGVMTNYYFGKSVEKFNCSNNQLTKLNVFQFGKMKELNASNNKIESLENEVDAMNPGISLPKTAIIDLSHNLLTPDKADLFTEYVNVVLTPQDIEEEEEPQDPGTPSSITPSTTTTPITQQGRNIVASNPDAHLTLTTLKGVTVAEGVASVQAPCGGLFVATVTHPDGLTHTQKIFVR